MRVVYMGTPSFSAHILQELQEHHDVVAVFTRPDAVRGRGAVLSASPVKMLASEYNIPVYTPRTLRDPEVLELLHALDPEIICVAAYGALLPKEILNLAPYGCINVHASLLPKWRGAAPIERALLAGDKELGVCIMRMEEGLDTGDYCVSRSLTVREEDLLPQLMDKLADLGARALLTALEQIAFGRALWTVQDESLVTYAHKLEKEEFYLSPSDSCIENKRRVQASSRAHPASCNMAGKRVVVEQAHVLSNEEIISLCNRLKEGSLVCENLEQGCELLIACAQGKVPPSLELASLVGKLILASKKLYAVCADGVLEIVSVKPEGKASMTGAQFASGIQSIKKIPSTWERLD